MSIQINGPRLKVEIARRGLTQGEFAAVAGIVPNTLSNIAAGKPVQQVILMRIALALQNTPILERLDELIATPAGAA